MLAGALAASAALAGPAAASEPGAHHLFTFDGIAAGDRFGAAVAGAGDVDGDGRPDLIAGAPFAEVGGAKVGLARVLSGRDGALLLEVAGTETLGRFGASVAGVGDVDGDGTPDVAVGAPFGCGGAGCARVYSGADGALLLALAGEAPGDRFGAALAAAGDADGDGRMDVAVGAPESNAAATHAGRVSVHSGADGALVWSIDGSAPFDQLGASLASLAGPLGAFAGLPGDLDGDGVGELVVGAPFADAKAFNGGSAMVVSGSDGSVLLAHHGSGIGDQLGFSVAAAGDADGDGTADVVATAPGADAAGIDSGAALVVSGASGALLLAVAGEGTAEYLSAAAGVGDADGDGRADLAVGAAAGGPSQAGRVRVVSGADGAVLASFDGQQPFAWLGSAVCGLGDANGDGSPDLAAGAPGHDDHPEVTGAALALSTVALSLASDEHEVSVSAGGTQELALSAPPALAGEPYLLLGSLAGTEPATPVDAVALPLALDEYLVWTAAHPNAPPLAGSFGLLDAGARAGAAFSLPPAGAPELAGIGLHHAYLVFGPGGAAAFASVPAPLTLVP